MKKVKVRVLHPAIGEESTTYFRGAEFITTAERAKALGDAVEIVGEVPDEAPAGGDDAAKAEAEAAAPAAARAAKAAKKAAKEGGDKGN